MKRYIVSTYKTSQIIIAESPKDALHQLAHSWRTNEDLIEKDFLRKIYRAPRTNQIVIRANLNKGVCQEVLREESVRIIEFDLYTTNVIRVNAYLYMLKGEYISPDTLIKELNIESSVLIHVMNQSVKMEEIEFGYYIKKEGVNRIEIYDTLAQFHGISPQDIYVMIRSKLYLKDLDKMKFISNKAS